MQTFILLTSWVCIPLAILPPPGLDTPVELKLKLIPMLQHMHHDASLASSSRELLQHLVNSYPSTPMVIVTLHTFTQLAASSLIDIPKQVCFSYIKWVCELDPALCPGVRFLYIWRMHHTNTHFIVLVQPKLKFKYIHACSPHIPQFAAKALTQKSECNWRSLCMQAHANLWLINLLVECLWYNVESWKWFSTSKHVGGGMLPPIVESDRLQLRTCACTLEQGRQCRSITN